MLSNNKMYKKTPLKFKYQKITGQTAPCTNVSSGKDKQNVIKVVTNIHM
jgi:hypothetical protein